MKNSVIAESGRISSSEENTDEEDSEKHGSIILPQLLERERKFFEIVSKDDVPKVDQFLKENPKFNINCINFQGVSALHIAVKINSQSMVKCLLEKSNVEIGDCLLHAIEQNQIEIAELLLDRLKKINKYQEYQGCVNSSDFPDHMTPILLAASCGHYEIIQMLIKRGHKIEKPHSAFCKCKKCKDQIKNEDILNTARLRLSLYKAVINPAFISNSSHDPILTAFLLSDDLLHRSVIEPNFRSEYLNMANETRLFVVELIDCCRNAKEMELILKQREGMRTSLMFSHPRLLLAMDSKQKEFIAHSNTQQIVQSIWCGTWYKWLTMTTLEKIMHFILRIFLLPIIILTHILMPKLKLVEKWRSPVSKFISHVVTYFIFLSLLLIESLQDKRNQRKSREQTGIEFLIYLFVISHIWNLIRMCILQGVRRFFRIMWNWYDCVMICLFTGTLTIWSIQYMNSNANDLNIERKFWSDFEPILIGEAMFTIATIMAFLRLLFLCGLDYYLDCTWKDEYRYRKICNNICNYYAIFFSGFGTFLSIL